MGRAHREIKQGLGFQSGSLSLAADPRAHEVDPSGRRAQATVILKSSAGVVLVSATACAIPCRVSGWHPGWSGVPRTSWTRVRMACVPQ